MRLTIISLAIFTGLIAGSQTAAARSHTWCGLSSTTGDRECSFTSRKQCRASFRQCSRQ
jgi:hypothetical protein